MVLVKVLINIIVVIGSCWKSVGIRIDSFFFYFEILFDGSVIGFVIIVMNGKIVEGFLIMNECYEGWVSIIINFLLGI